MLKIVVFRVLINLGLKLVGAEFSQDAIDQELGFIESFFGSHVYLRAQGVGIMADHWCIGLPVRRSKRYLSSIRLLRYFFRYSILLSHLCPIDRIYRARTSKEVPSTSDPEHPGSSSPLRAGRSGHPVRAQYDLPIRLFRLLGCISV